MSNILSSDSIDFSKYMLESESKQKVRPAAEYVQDLIDDLGVYRKPVHAFLPWEKTHQVFHFRPGEVTLWVGVNGHGKSQVTGLVALSLCTQEERVCIASFEMKPTKTLERMVRQFSGQTPPQAHDFNDRGVMASFRDTYEQFQTFTDRRMWLYDQQGTVDTKTLIGVIRYCAKELHIKHFFIDSLMKCIAGEDDYNGQKLFIDQVTSIARDTGMHIHVIHHSKKLANEEAMPDKMDVKGSGSITDQVDNLLIVWRNKKKERSLAEGKRVADDEPDALLICDKQRNGEWEGRISLWYERASQQFVGAPAAQPLNFFGDFPHRSGF